MRQKYTNEAQVSDHSRNMPHSVAPPCRLRENLRADGFRVLAERVYEGPDDWDFRDKAIADALAALCAARKEEA